MKNTITSFLFTLLCLSGFAQSIINPTWIKTEAGTANGDAEGWGVDVDSLGNIYWPVNVNKQNQGLDILCYKYQADGSEIWASPFIYGGLGTQQAYVCNAKDTAIYIGGRSCSGLVNTCDMMLLKVDKSTGSLIWDKTLNFSGNGYEEIDGLEIKDDGIYCGGWAQEIQSGNFQTDIGLWKLDFSGNTIWSNYFGAPNTAEHQDGHFVVDDDKIYAAGLWGGTNLGNLYNGYSFLGQFSKTDGSFIDSTLFGTQSNNFLDIENALGMTSDGDFLYITGYSTPVSVNDWQIFVAKFDKELNQLWYIDWGGDGTESARGIAVDNGIIYVAGTTESSSIVTGGNRDALLLQLDTSGNILSYQTWGDTLKNSLHDIVVQNNNIYLTGTSEPNSSGANKIAFLLSIDATSTSIDEVPSQEFSDFTFFPNPTHGHATISFNGKDHQGGEVKIIDVQGRLISTEHFDSNTSELNISIKSTGLFLVNVDFGQYSITKKIVNQHY